MSDKLDNAIDRTHLLGQLKVILETIIHLQSEQLKIQKQMNKIDEEINE